MSRKIVKRLMVLIAAFTLIGVAVYFIWKVRVERLDRSVVAEADLAAEQKDYAKAVEGYRQHLQVFPEDIDVQIKYADILTDHRSTQKDQQNAMTILRDILRRQPGNQEVRRRAADLAVQMGMFEVAREHLENLLKTAKEDGHLEYLEDGHLEYLLGRCYEQERDAPNATDYYRKAVDHGAPERLDAAQRLAALLRDPLGRPEEADRVIEAMVQAATGNYRVYLERGRYRRRFELKGADEDFRKALELAPEQPEIYLEAAQLAERKTGLDEARKVLEQGLKAVPPSPGLSGLYLALADLQHRRTGRIDQSIQVLERGLEAMPDQVELRWQLALRLAASGASSKLLPQIQEMKNSGVTQIPTDYLMAYYYINKNEFKTARTLLTALQPLVAQSGYFKARVNVLLARCYGQLGEPGLQWDAQQRAVAADPGNVQAKLELIQGMVNRGDIAPAIEQYRGLVAQMPQLRLRLARLLLLQNQQRPAERREWGEIEKLIDAAAKAEPGSAEPVVLRAVLLAERGQTDKALEVLHSARTQFPQAVEPWITEAQLLRQGKKYDEALGVLDRAQKALGDRVEFRLGRAQIWVRKGGPKALAALNALGDNLGSFPKESQRALLAILATELTRQQQDLQGAVRMWSRLAELDPESLDPHLSLFALGFQTADPALIEKEIQEITRLDSSHGTLYQADYLIWQAGRSKDQAERERLRTDARALLTELKTRRPDWALIPLAMAKMEEQELAPGKLDQAHLQEKMESLITTYLRAIELGSRDPAVLRRAVQLLFAANRGSEAFQLISRVPAVSQFVDMGRLASQFAAGNRDFSHAEEIARKAVAARPEDFQERFWLVKILMDSGQPDKAEAEIRGAIAAAKDDRGRWVTTLVDFLVQTKHPDRAEKEIQQAEAALSKTPLALAQCCEVLGNGYQRSNNAEQAKAWYDRARQWFVKAKADQKDPNDLTVDRQLAAFFLRTNQLAEAQRLLEILSQKGGAQAAAARRSLALTYIAGNPRQPAKALAILEAAGGQASDDPEDQRALAQVLEAQGTPEHRKRAIAILNTLVDQNVANFEDQFRLAELEDRAGDGPKAIEQYRRLVLRTNNPTDLETARRRPLYITQFAESLLRHHRANETSDLDEVQELIEKLKQIQPDLLAALVLEVKLDKARDQSKEAADRIRSADERPKIGPVVRLRLAELAEEIDQPELAEQILRRNAAESATFNNRLPLVQFLVRHKHVDRAVELCDSLWKEGKDREGAARLVITALADPNAQATPEQINRGIGWLQQGIQENPRSALYRSGLGSLYERLGQDQKAKEQYRAVINIGDREGIASNNLAWLMALSGENVSEALALANKAIQVQGPHPEFLDTRGVVYLSAGQGPSAVKDLEEAVKVRPTGPKYFHLTQAYLLVNDKAKAKKSWEAAKKLGLPKDLHRLERDAYQKVLSELG